MIIKAKTEILPEAQQELWPLLNEVPSDFVLYGGTAVALRYGHRQSVDFDFFTSKQNIDLLETGLNIPFIRENLYDIRNRSRNQVDFVVGTSCREPVKITFLNHREVIPGAVRCPDIIQGINLKIASPLDLMATKILALQTRTEAKDYVDIATMMNHGLLLRNGFEAAYAIARLNDSVKMNLQLDAVRKFLMTDGIKSRIENCNVKELQKNASKTAFTLANAAKYIKMEAIYKTTLEASRDIEKGGKDYGLSL